MTSSVEWINDAPRVDFFILIAWLLAINGVTNKNVVLFFSLSLQSAFVRLTTAKVRKNKFLYLCSGLLFWTWVKFCGINLL